MPAQLELFAPQTPPISKTVPPFVALPQEPIVKFVPTQVAPPLEEQVPILQQVPATLAHRVVTELHNPLP